MSPLLHRDTTHYDLCDLAPGVTYTIDLAFLPHGHQAMLVANTRTIQFSTLREEGGSLAKDQYQGHVH